MAEVKDEVEELEELLVGLESEAQVEAYSEEDDEPTLSMAAPIGDQEWMVQLSPTNRKMMSTDRVVTELGLGTLTEATLVWRGGMEEWMPIAQVDDLTRARSSVPPPRPVPPPAPAPVVARSRAAAEAAASEAELEASAGAAEEDTNGAPEVEADDGDGPTPLVPPPPVEASAESERSDAPSRPRSYTGRPVAVDFSSVPPPKRSASLKALLGAGGAAAAMVLVTLFLLSRGGVFEASEVRSVSSLEPAPGAAPPPPSTAPAAPEPAAPAPAAPATPPAPAAGSATEATTPEAAAPSADAPAAPNTDAAPSMGTEEPPAKDTSGIKRTRIGIKRVRPKASQAAAAVDSSEEPAPRAKPAASRSKTRSVAAKQSQQPSANEEAEEPPAPSPGPTVGFNRQAAQAALKDAAAQAGNCRPAGGPTGSGRVQVRYDATGRVGSVSILTPGFENTTTGSCIQMVFRRAKIASFTGAPVVMTESFEIK